MKTSIIIPTHNRSAMVREVITSAVGLDGHEDREIIVVNDGSTDDTAEVLASFGSRIRVEHVDHGERSRARNRGAELARGQYLFFVDDDDLLLPAGLPALERAAEESSPETGMVYGLPRYLKTHSASPLCGTLPDRIGTCGWIYPTLLGLNFIVMGTALVRREAFLELGGFRCDLVELEDWDFWLRLSQQWSVGFVDIPVSEIRLHGANSTAGIERAGRATEYVREWHLLSPELREYVRRRSPVDGPSVRMMLAQRCVDLARRRWWEGEYRTCRLAIYQSFRLAPLIAMAALPACWRAWIPLQRPPWMRRRPTN